MVFEIKTNKYVVDWKKMKRYILIFLIMFAPVVAHADDMLIDTSRQMQIASLKREISELEIKLSECSRKNKNWRTATWIGAAGTVATGTAAIVQSVKLNKLKRENKANDKETDGDNKDEKK